MKRKEREALWQEDGFHNVSQRIAAALEKLTDVECRTVIPGHMQRGGSPCAYDRVLSTQFGVHAAHLIKKEKFGVSVALKGGQVGENKLEDIAGVPKPVDPEDHLVKVARNLNISFGD
jgi:6-phosphofructokinase 1